TLSPFVIPSRCTSASPLSRMVAAMRVKSPFSQSALFGFMGSIYDGQADRAIWEFCELATRSRRSDERELEPIQSARAEHDLRHAFSEFAPVMTITWSLIPGMKFAFR